MARIGIFFGSTDGNTERIMGQLQELLGETNADLHNVNSATGADMEDYDFLILSCPTWEIGELQEDWDSFIDELDDANLEGKKVAFIGLGDADGYPDTFLDALGIIYDRIKDKGCTIVGQWPKDGYNYEGSKAEIDGQLIGLGIDEDNEADLTEGRLTEWVALIKPEFGL